MKKTFVYLGTMTFNGEPSKVWLILGTVFIASSIVRKRIQIDIAYDDSEPRRLTKQEQEFFNHNDLSI